MVACENQSVENSTWVVEKVHYKPTGEWIKFDKAEQELLGLPADVFVIKFTDTEMTFESKFGSDRKLKTETVDYTFLDEVFTLTNHRGDGHMLYDYVSNELMGKNLNFIIKTEKYF